MFLKMKSRVLRMLVCAAAGALCLYSGAACAATLYKAHGQPYLLAGVASLILAASPCRFTIDTHSVKVVSKDRPLKTRFKKSDFKEIGRAHV